MHSKLAEIEQARYSRQLLYSFKVQQFALSIPVHLKEIWGSDFYIYSVTAAHHVIGSTHSKSSGQWMCFGTYAAFADGFEEDMDKLQRG
jgi:hypothetical protein